MSKDQGPQKTPASQSPEASQDAPSRAAAPADCDDAKGDPADEPLPPPPAEPLLAEDAGEREEAKREYLVQRFRFTARGFWGRAGDRLAWPLTLGVLALILTDVGLKYGINVWNRRIFDALEARKADTVLFLSAIFVPLAVVSVSCGVANVYARMTVQRRWRAWLTGRVIDRWLHNGRYFQLNLVTGDHDNPEYRIAQDLRVATDAPVDFTVGVVTAGLSAATFITVLWTIGGALSFHVGGVAVTIPGFLVVAAVVYSFVASGLMLRIGRRFVTVSERVNQAEADYRYALTRVRENGESIALLGGEAEERAGLDRTFAEVLRQWRKLLGQHMRTTFVSQGSSVLAPVVPIILAAPKFLDGSMSLGQMMQAASAFTIVQAAFGWLVDNYPRLADWSAGARRIASLMVSLDALERAENGEGMGRIQRGETDGAAVRLRDLSVTLDDGTAVIDDAEVEVAPGERVLVAGESGTGKSTLVRAISGLWPWGGGSIDLKSGARLFLLPQRPYVPQGTLRRAIAYPAAAEDWSTQEIAAALKRVGLEHLVERIEEEAPWDQTLSGGERQRLAFGRLLLHRPDIIVLDESTSALDPASQEKLMALLAKELDQATVISVGHRPELEAFHSRKIVLERKRGAARFVSDIHLVPRPGRTRLIHRWLRQRRRKKAAAAQGRAA
ncbi:MAG TPA: ABC transporter ATP-binding protein/permease [Xanthobacteraceae bacterium]|nr:ABC transporter ATP-binding protein/permease [Xanthobacteraceae bacterium]